MQYTHIYAYVHMYDRQSSKMCLLNHISLAEHEHIYYYYYMYSTILLNKTNCMKHLCVCLCFGCFFYLLLLIEFMHFFLVHFVYLVFRLQI